MASIEIEYNCKECGHWGCTGIRQPEKCEECDSKELRVITNNLEFGE